MRAIEFIHRYSKRIIICSLILFVVIGFISLTKNSDRSADASTTNEKYFMCITIGYGDTLYDIAREYISEEYKSLDAYVAEVKEINNLTSDNIMSGASLVIPYYASEQK